MIYWQIEDKTMLLINQFMVMLWMAIANDHIDIRTKQNS